MSQTSKLTLPRIGDEIIGLRGGSIPLRNVTDLDEYIADPSGYARTHYFRETNIPMPAAHADESAQPLSDREGMHFVAALVAMHALISRDGGKKAPNPETTAGAASLYADALMREIDL